MKIIDELNQICEQNSVKAGYPAGISADFSPCLVEDLGDLVSDIAIRYADTLRSPPESIAKAICAQNPVSLSGELHADRGYVNCFLCEGVAVTVEDTILHKARKGEQIRIFLPHPYEPFSGGAFIRVAARAIVQAVCAQELGYAVRLEMGSYVENIVGTDRQWVVGFMKRCGEAAMDRAGYSTQNIWEVRINHVVDDAFEGRSFVWLLPALIRNGMVTECLQRSALRGLVHLCGIERKWAAVQADELSRVFKSTNVKQCIAELLYLASTLPSEEIDLSVPSLNEKSNLAWYYGVTISRLARWPHCTQPMGVRESINESIKILPRNHTLRSLLIKSLFAPVMMRRAAVNGAVPEYITWAADLLACIHRVLNTPQIRAALDGSPLGEGKKELMEISKILSFAHHILQAMLVLK